MNAPAIQSIGVPPDRHAERIVSRCCNTSKPDRRNAGPKPKARSSRRKWVRWLDSSARWRGPARPWVDLALSVELTPAKRGKYVLRLVSWIAFDPATNKVAPPGDPLPPGAQLAVIVAHSTGANHRPQWNAVVPLVTSRHACTRLAQRANVRGVGDLLVRLREL